MKNKVILLSSNSFGDGNGELGETVLETFFTLLKQREDKPKAIFCMNSGVLALTNESLTSLHLQEMEVSGVEVYACKTCVDFYNVEEKLLAGKISSMPHFLDLSSEYEVLTIN